MSVKSSFLGKIYRKISRKSTKKNNNKDFSNNVNEISGDYEYHIAEQQIEKLLKTPRNTKTSNINNNDRILRSRINKIMKKMERFNAIKQKKQKNENTRFLAHKKKQWNIEQQAHDNTHFRRSLPGVPKTNLEELALEDRFYQLTGEHTMGYHRTASGKTNEVQRRMSKSRNSRA
jgi:hypothetical protein